MKRTRTTYSKDKEKAVKRWETVYFRKILDYYSGRSMVFISKAIQMDRRNLLRKLKELELGPYKAKVGD